MTLNDYMTKNIFEPLGVKNVSMFPTPEMKSKLAFMNQRSYDGVLRSRDHILRFPLVAKDEAEVSRCLNSGGAGLFAQPSEYCSMPLVGSFLSCLCFSKLSRSHVPLPEQNSKEALMYHP